MKKWTLFFMSVCLVGAQFGWAEDICHKCIESTYLNQKIELMVQRPINQTGQAILFLHGAMAAALLATQRNDIIGIVCANGGYDLLRHKTENDLLFTTLVNKGYDLDINSDEALTIRSPIYHLSKISTPIFLLHRRGNPVVSDTEAIDFYNAMLATGKECYLVVREKGLEDDEQKLAYKEILLETESWLDSLMQKE